MKKEKSSIDYFIEIIGMYRLSNIPYIEDKIKKVKERHKKEIIEAYNEHPMICTTGSQYYAEKYSTN